MFTMEWKVITRYICFLDPDIEEEKDMRQKLMCERKQTHLSEFIPMESAEK